MPNVQRAARPRAPASRPVAAPSPLRLTILSTNDLHGQLEPLRRYTDEKPPRAYRVGGAEALAATIAELRSADPEGTLLLDGGDFMQGGLVANRFEGAPVRDLLALLRYDAVTIGNHEFDYGPVGVPDPPPGSGADPRGALRAWASRAPFPVLSANLRQHDGTPLPWTNVHSSVMVRRRGVAVGLIGLTTPETAITTMPAFAEGLRFDAWLPTVKREARALRSRGADLIVLLAHGAAECPRTDPSSCHGELFSGLLDKIEPGLVDVVVAGHSHRPMAHSYRGVFVMEGCSHGQLVSRLALSFDRRTRRLLRDASNPLLAVHVCHDVFRNSGDCSPAEANAAPGPVVENPLLAKHRSLVEQVDRALARYRDGIGDSPRRVLARAARPLVHERVGISQVGTFFATALLDSVRGADAALFNGGSVRADLPSGDIHYSDLYEAFPFDNRVSTVRLTAAELTRVIAKLLTRVGMPVVAGLQVRMRCGPPRELLALLDGRGRPLRPGRLYTVALNDFLLSGGDGLGPIFGSVPAVRKRVYRDRLIRDVIAGYLERQREPLNTGSRPVVSAQWPPLIFEGGSCHAPPNRPPHSFCR